ncbi:MAG: MarR family transcriptional regulator [Bacteroidetes bacterium]|nr:MarR family transcriptional regulator [Bacteroidota bacterium]
MLHLISIKEEDVIQKDMADCLGKDKSSVLRLIDSLEKKDLIRRVVDKKDRRKNYLMITKKGERVIKQIKEISFEMMKEMQEGISETELQIFRNVAGLLISNAEKL